MNQPNQQSPCKLFNKKNAITCYRLLANWEEQRLDHYEFIRISNPKDGEYYLFPIETLQKFTNRHISYHKSGAFHWRENDGSRVYPVEGEADLRRAILMTQAVNLLDGRLDGYCIAKGKNVSDESMNVMLSILDGYIVPSLEDNL